MKFDDLVLEEKFQKKRIKADLIAIRSTIIILALVYVVLILFDTVLFPDTYHKVSWIRICLFLPISAICFALTFSKDYLRLYRYVNMSYFVAITLAHSYLSASVSRMEYGYNYVLLIYVIIFILAYPVFSIGIHNNIAILAIGLLMNIYIGIFVHQVFINNTFYMIIAESVILVAFWFTGFFVGNAIEKNRRKVFLLNQELENQNAQLSEIVELDWLTNIYNRRAFHTNLETAITQALEEKTTFALIMLDIDFFKNYNDSYGHLAGDECLKRIATITCNSVRSDDIVARYGGEEFAVIVNGVKNRADLEKICQNIIHNIENAKIPNEGSPLGYVTVCIGANLVLPNNDTRAEDIINCADKALYISKKQGKNQSKIC